MYCQDCGKPVPLNSKYCQHCGTAVVEITTKPQQEPDFKTEKPNGLSRKHIILGMIACLVLTALCTPLVLFSRSQVLSSLLNPENRSLSILPEPSENQSSSISSSSNSTNQDTSQTSQEGSDSPTDSSFTENTPTPEGIQIRLFEGNILGYSQPPDRVVYADDQAGPIPEWVQLAPFCQTGCFRYNGWLGLVTAGDSYDVIFTEPTDTVGVQFWGDPGDGIAHVYLDGQLVWEGDTEGTDVNYPGGAFVNYLQISNLPLIPNHILRIETDPAGGAVTMYFFGSGPVMP